MGSKKKAGSGHIGFKKLEAKLSGHVSNPAAVAATIGREKYGVKGMAAKAAAGRRKASKK